LHDASADGRSRRRPEGAHRPGDDVLQVGAVEGSEPRRSGRGVVSAHLRDVTDDSIRARTAAAEAALRGAGSTPENARIDADVLARHVLGWDRATLLLRRDEPMAHDAADAYAHLIARRVRREPVAYLTGTRE